MSRTTHLMCQKCKVAIWIGQRDYIYTGAEYLDRLNAFLQNHQSYVEPIKLEEIAKGGDVWHDEHPLIFCDMERQPDDYIELETGGETGEEVEALRQKERNENLQRIEWLRVHDWKGIVL